MNLITSDCCSTDVIRSEIRDSFVNAGKGNCRLLIVAASMQLAWAYVRCFLTGPLLPTSALWSQLIYAMFICLRAQAEAV